MYILPGLILLIYFGYLFTILVFKNISIVERLAYSYLSGLGLLAILAFSLSFFNIKFTAVNSILMLIAGSCVFFMVAKKMKNHLKDDSPQVSEDFTGLTNIEKKILTLIILLFVSSFILASYWPISVWDALSLYDMRAKVIADSGSIISSLTQLDYYALYPPLTSIVQAFVYLMKSANSQFLYSFVYLSLLVVFYFRLKVFTKRTIALLFTLIVALTPAIFQHSTIAYTNLLYATYFFISTVYMFMYAKEGNIRYLIISAFINGLTTWTRSYDPFWMTNIVFLILLFFSNRELRRIKDFIIYLIVFIPIQQLWALYLTNVLHKTYSSIGLILRSYSLFRIDINQIIAVTKYLLDHIVFPWGLVFFLFVFLLFKEHKSYFSKPKIYFIGLTLINILVLVGGTYYYSMADPAWVEIGDSAKRMSMVFIPLFLFAIGMSESVMRLFFRK